MRTGNGRQGVRNRVAGAESLLESDGAEGAAEQHLLAGFEVLAVLHGALEVRTDPPQTVDGDGVGERMIALRDVRLQVVREGVHSRRGRDERRQAHRTLRVEE